MSTLATSGWQTRPTWVWMRLRVRRVIGALCLLFLMAAGTLWLAVRGHLPGTADVVAVARFAGSPQFVALSPEEQKPYVRAMTEHRWLLATAVSAGQLTQPEVDAAFRNSWTLATAQYLEEYATLATPADRRAYLDRIIDEQEKYRLFKRAASAPLKSEPGERKSPSPWVGQPKLKKMIETMPPGQRAQLSEFHADLRKRRLERGMGR